MFKNEWTTLPSGIAFELNEEGIPIRIEIPVDKIEEYEDGPLLYQDKDIEAFLYIAFGQRFTLDRWDTGSNGSEVARVLPPPLLKE